MTMATRPGSLAILLLAASPAAAVAGAQAAPPAQGPYEPAAACAR